MAGVAADWHRLALEYRPLALGYARQFGRSCPRHADDFRGAACLALCEASRSFDAARGYPAEKWVRAKVRQQLINEYNRLKSTPRHAPLEDWDIPEERTEAGDYEGLIAQLASGLPRKFAAAFVAWADDPSHASRRLGIPPATMHRRLATAHRLIRQRFPEGIAELV